MPIELVPITPENALLFKEVRLRALKTDPSAFGSTYAKESLLDDAGWIQRIRYWGEYRTGFLALDGDLPCGMIAVFPDEDNPGCAQLISMWVAPEHRQTGLGRHLIDAAKSWAASHAFRELRLFVTCINKGAIEFYIRNGFAKTGRVQPYPNDPNVIEYEMATALTPPRTAYPVE
ncbi:GNAT family N-acetyltransferase [Alloacidobacterium sp.]|uniref:GNAT family N-acetyltransferase n=1 Tax=Alloacidobacterium sp. TaxID=2951999 RepID=UPI002D35BCB0|nr:GNAT family N-acetyltransferase [Alloacidobacterium sp.]HYK37586.1 GNAT family N-acetyltransferase [Alloacidobacterium sp.]